MVGFQIVVEIGAVCLILCVSNWLNDACMRGASKGKEVWKHTFVTCRDVDWLPQQFAVSWLDCATINHDTRSIVSCESHDCAGHVLVTSWDSDTSIMKLFIVLTPRLDPRDLMNITNLSTSNSLNTISNNLPSTLR